MRMAKILHQATLVLWAVLLAFCLMAVVGMTGLLSHLVGQGRVEMAVDVIFLVLVVAFALLLARLCPPPQNIVLKTLAFFTPLIFFLTFFTFS